MLRYREIRTTGYKRNFSMRNVTGPYRDHPFFQTFAGFPRFIDAAPLSRSDLLPSDPAHHSLREDKIRKVGTVNIFSVTLL